MNKDLEIYLASIFQKSINYILPLEICLLINKIRRDSLINSKVKILDEKLKFFFLGRLFRIEISLNNERISRNL